MSNEEALRLIKASQRCLVLWSIAENEVVAVKPFRTDASSEEQLSTLLTLLNEHTHTQGRFFDSATVSMSTLLEEQARIGHAASRVRVLRTWHTCHTDDLVNLLETGDFPAPMNARGDAHLLIDEIYYARAAGLSSRQLSRLDAVAAQTFFSPLGSAAAYKLECGLAVIQQDRQRLERFWRVRLAKRRDRVFSADFATFAGDLALDLDEVIEYFVAAVEFPGLFEPRFRAMLALGKIGGAAGARAADTIAAHIYDSSDAVRQLRDQVLARICTPSSDWTMCGSCVRGMVSAADVPVFDPCPQCLGLGHARAGTAQPAVAGVALLTEQPTPRRS